MAEDPRQQGRALHAYRNEAFLASREGRALRLLAEYLEPKARFERQKVEDTIVFMGSARTPSREQAEADLAAAQRGEGDAELARLRVGLARYYEAARELAARLTQWSRGLDEPERRFVVCTGGGPGIMEAGNRGAAEAGGPNVGLGITLPTEEFANPYITPELNFHFHYFFMRKFWFAYHAKAVVFFPGGFGTFDELFELLTLVQTGKIRKHLPLVLFGTAYWNEVVNFEALANYGMIGRKDLDLVFRTDSVDDAFEYLTRELLKHGLPAPGPRL
jgi:uncharacterized protein (TIGR00730 family)